MIGDLRSQNIDSSIIEIGTSIVGGAHSPGAPPH